MPKDMSWLSPKRRRTTGNLKAVPNGQVASVPASAGSDGIPESPSTLERSQSAYRPLSQPAVSFASSNSNGSVGESGGDGNLFYAYARKGDDLKSRYLLTFASAAVANEWWFHLQNNFPDTSRPGAQLFSFKTEDLLSKAWKHPSFSHLKSKWMWISINPETNGAGSAAQGIIPVQDAYGNVLGGSQGIDAEVRKEAKVVRHDVHRLEENFESMMRAVEKNTEQVAKLAEKQAAVENGTTKEHPHTNGASGGGYFDMDALSSHFGRMNDLLSRQSQHIENLTKKHQENERQLRKTIENLSSQKHNDYLDMAQLASHLDRIQNLLEKSVTERKDSVQEAPASAPQIDFSPLTDRLDKMHNALQGNSTLMQQFLDEVKGDDNEDGKPEGLFKDRNRLLTESLEKIHGAMAQQSEHTKALVGYASGENKGDTSQVDRLALLDDRLGEIHNAIETANKHALESQKLDLSPLAAHLEALREHSAKQSEHMQQLVTAQSVSREPQSMDLGPLEKHLEALREQSEQQSEHMRQMVEAQQATREAVELNGGEIDFTAVAEQLDSIKESGEVNVETIRELMESQRDRSVDLTPLTDHLQAMRTGFERSNEHMRSLVDSATKSDSFDLTPLTDRLNNIHVTLEKQSERSSSPGHGDPKFIISALSSHLSKMQGVMEKSQKLTESNANAVKTLHTKQVAQSTSTQSAISDTSDQLRQLLKRNQESVEATEVQNSQMRELMSGQREMVEVMRQLAKSVVAQSKGACDHVVVPPPRKTGRKVVGFVYDAKDGVA